ncbi:hypothetical protein SAMN06265349_103443 [Flavobacterium resistens]|uniref:Uncharacterized protein n=1 Tax=Flavobacterium resistens TaxID=443612 RepID=A0A521DQS5_9FLAO|nr:hypothetical protein SAMN06265349_103443 [Flavobacterium resistens]
MKIHFFLRRNQISVTLVTYFNEKQTYLCEPNFRFANHEN